MRMLFIMEIKKESIVMNEKLSDKERLTIKTIVKSLGGKPNIQLTEPEAEKLIEWIKSVNPKTIVECGTAYGGSGLLIKTLIPEIELVTYDKVQEEPLPAWVKSENDIGKYLPSDVKLFIGDSVEILPRLLNEFKPELVFHDNGHDYRTVKKNLEQCKEFGIGYVIVHDSNIPDVSKAIRDSDYQQIEYFKDREGMSLLKLKKGKERREL